jgi:hypothetical protein
MTGAASAVRSPQMSLLYAMDGPLRSPMSRPCIKTGKRLRPTTGHPSIAAGWLSYDSGRPADENGDQNDGLTDRAQHPSQAKAGDI